MTESIHVLFCDNDGKRHKAFRDDVLPFLITQLPTCSFTAYYSQSLDPEFEEDYESEPKGLGAKSVKTLLAEGVKFDLVITDMDFGLQPTRGHSETGLDVIEEVAKTTHRDCPWLRFILITAHAERAGRGRLLDIAQYYLGGDERAQESFIELSQEDPAVNWDKVRLRAGELVLKIIRDRSHFTEVMAGITAPELYEVVIFRRDVSDDQMRVVVRERGEGGNALGFRLGAQSVTFGALAEILGVSFRKENSFEQRLGERLLLWATCWFVCDSTSSVESWLMPALSRMITTTSAILKTRMTSALSQAARQYRGGKWVFSVRISWERCA